MKTPPHLRSLKPGMAEKLMYYVYLYVDPRSGMYSKLERIRMSLNCILSSRTSNIRSQVPAVFRYNRFSLARK